MQLQWTLKIATKDNVGNEKIKKLIRKTFFFKIKNKRFCITCDNLPLKSNNVLYYFYLFVVKLSINK